jgi:hypothetical protein
VSPVRPKVTVVGRRLELEDHRLRDFLTRLAQPYEWVEAGSSEALELLGAHGLADDELPVLIEQDSGMSQPQLVGIRRPVALLGRLAVDANDPTCPRRASRRPSG